MAIQSIEESKTLKKYGSLLGREGLALRIQEICEAVPNGSYKEAIEAAGKIMALAKACKYDCYWEEKMSKGYYDELRYAEHELLKQLNDK